MPKSSKVLIIHYKKNKKRVQNETKIIDGQTDKVTKEQIFSAHKKEIEKKKHMYTK